MKFKVDASYEDCLSVYFKLSRQERLWFGYYEEDFYDVVVHRKLIRVDSIPVGFCEVVDNSKLCDGIEYDCGVSVAVISKYRNKGIGYGLVSEVVSSFEENGFKSLTYKVNQGNLPSIRLAERCGLTRLSQNLLYENIQKTDFVYVAGKMF